MITKRTISNVFINDKLIYTCVPGKNCKEGKTFCPTLKLYVDCKWRVITEFKKNEMGATKTPYQLHPTVPDVMRPFGQRNLRSENHDLHYTELWGELRGNIAFSPFVLSKAIRLVDGYLLIRTNGKIKFLM